jgi:hypothetical protein
MVFATHRRLKSAKIQHLIFVQIQKKEQIYNGGNGFATDAI